MGDFYNPGLNFIKINYVPCMLDSGCQDDPSPLFGAIMNIIYLDGYYKSDTLNTSDSPVGYKIVSDFNFYMDPVDATITQFNLHYNKVMKLDGTNHTFYDFRLQYQSFVYAQQFGFLDSGILMDQLYTIYREEMMPQPVLPSVRRRMETTTNSDGTLSTITVTAGKEEKEMSMIFAAFYVIANLGGFYTFLMFLFGFFMKPAIDKMFMHEIVNATHHANKQAIGILTFHYFT
jgi:hypothetical protein